MWCAVFRQGLTIYEDTRQCETSIGRWGCLSPKTPNAMSDFLSGLWEHWLVKTLVAGICVLLQIEKEAGLALLVLFIADGLVTLSLWGRRHYDRKTAIKEFSRVLLFVFLTIIFNVTANGIVLLSWLAPTSFAWMAVAELGYILKGLSRYDRRILFFVEELQKRFRKEVDKELVDYATTRVPTVDEAVAGPPQNHEDSMPTIPSPDANAN